jgi:hypothetical protein
MAGDRWVDWMCDSPALILGSECLDRHAFFGVAGANTARL